jgi:hypothetical protein
MTLREFFTERLPAAARILIGRSTVEPRPISPIAVEEGATVTGIAHAREGAAIEGGGIIVQPGFDLKIADGAVALMMAAGGTAGRFRCSCGDVGKCSLVSTTDPMTGVSTLKCQPDATCTQCKFTLVLDPKFRLVIA